MKSQLSLERELLRDHARNSAYSKFYDAKKAELEDKMKVYCADKELEFRLEYQQIVDPTQREAARMALHYHCKKSNRKNYKSTGQQASQTIADKKIHNSTPTKKANSTWPGFRAIDPCVFKITADSFKPRAKPQEPQDLEPLSIIHSTLEVVLELQVNADEEHLAFTSTEQTPESSQQPTSFQTPPVSDLAPTPSPGSDFTTIQDFGLIPLVVPVDRCDRPPKLSKKAFLTPASIKEGVTTFENPPGVQRSTGYVFNNNEDFEHDVNLPRTKMEWTVEEICEHKRKRGGRGRGGLHYKVQWSDGTKTWEPKRNITHAKDALGKYCTNKGIDSNGNKKPRLA